MRSFNEDCITGMVNHVEDGVIDLIFTDPPYGIAGDKLDQVYNRDDSFIVPGYIDVPRDSYAEFSCQWINQCERVLKPGGSIYIVSGYSNLVHILNSLHATSLIEVNHLIAQYSFGVYTKNKFVSSHYHILFWYKKGKRTFNTNAFYSDSKESYNDRLSVQPLIRKYQTGKKRYQNQLPVKFIQKFIAYSSNKGDIVLDPFAGSFSTRDAALNLERDFIGFEKNEHAFNEFSEPDKTIFDL